MQRRMSNEPFSSVHSVHSLCIGPGVVCVYVCVCARLCVGVCVRESVRARARASESARARHTLTGITGMLRDGSAKKLQTGRCCVRVDCID